MRIGSQQRLFSRKIDLGHFVSGEQLQPREIRMLPVQAVLVKSGIRACVQPWSGSVVAFVVYATNKAGDTEFVQK